MATHKAYNLKAITRPSASSTVHAVNRPAMPSMTHTNKIRVLHTYMPHMHSNLFNTGNPSLFQFNANNHRSLIRMLRMLQQHCSKQARKINAGCSSNQ